MTGTLLQKGVFQKGVFQNGVFRKKTRRVWLVLAALMGLVGPFAPAPAIGQPTGRLELAGQTPYVNADGEFNIALDWTGPRSEDLQLTVTVHGVVSEEGELESPPSEILNRTTALSLNEIDTNEFGQLVTTVPIRSFTPADDGRLWLEQAGVYPVTIEIRSSDGPVATTRTNLIRLPTETAELELLPVGIILSVASADGLTIGEASALLANHPTVPLSVLLGDGVLAQLNDDPGLAETFRTSVNGRPVLAGPELSLDPSALAEIGQGALYQDALIATRTSITELGLEPTETTLPIDLPLTVEGAQLLVELGIERAVDVSASSQVGGSIAAPGGPLQVVRIDDELTSEFAARSRAASRAHHLLARLAVRYETDRTPIVLGGPAIAKAEINSLEILLSAVDQLGLLEAVDLNDSVGGQLPVRPAESPSQDLQNLETEIGQTLATIDTYESFHITGGTSPEELRAELLSALSRDLNPENRARATTAVAASIDSALNVVTLAETESVTVAARSSTIPLTINNSASGPRSVLLRFQTDKVDVVQHGAIIEIPAGTSQLDIEVETRSLGLSPLEMVVLTPDERHELTRTSFQVRSTAVPGLGMLLSGTALVFLLIWWGRSIARSRREVDAEDLDAPTETDDDDSLDPQPVIGADA